MASHVESARVDSADELYNSDEDLMENDLDTSDAEFDYDGIITPAASAVSHLSSAVSETHLDVGTRLLTDAEDDDINGASQETQIQGRPHAGGDLCPRQIEISEGPLKPHSDALAFLQDVALDLMDQIKHSMQLIAGHEGKHDVLADSDVEMDLREPTDLAISLIDRKTGKETTASYPANPHALKKIARVLKASACLAQAIQDDVVVTKRDIFYQDVALFRKQVVVDKIVDDLVATAGLRRRDFHVCASSKGLVASSCLRLHLEDGTHLTIMKRTGTLIPPAERMTAVESGEQVDWVLIVEKDAIFNALLQTDLLSGQHGVGVLITGKGYPDLATLQLLSSLAETFPLADFYGLVDADPHGLGILAVYADGSSANRHSEDYRDLVLGDRLQWLGLRASEMASMVIGLETLLPLTKADWTLALSMLRSQPHMGSDARRELSYMLHVQRKAEIQVLMSATEPSATPEGTLEADPAEYIQHLRTSAQRLADYIIDRIAKPCEDA